MTPTHVFGQSAREYADAMGWTDATIIEGTKLNAKTGVGGISPDAPRIIHCTEGDYRKLDGVDGFLGERPYVVLTGDPVHKARFQNVPISSSYSQLLKVENQDLKNSPVKLAHPSKDGPMDFEIVGNYFHEWTTDQNGVGDPDDQIYPRTTRITGNIFDAVGSTGNTKHAVYIHGRSDDDFLIVEDNHFVSSRACSSLKCDVMNLEVRRNFFGTKSLLSPYTTHTMIDAASCAKITIHDNDFDVWRGPVGGRAGQNGLQTAPIFPRRRRDYLGADRPAVPATYDRDARRWIPAWNPPNSGVFPRFSPGEGWTSGPETYANDAFWAWARAKDRRDPTNEATFKAFISGNRAKCLDEAPSKKTMPFVMHYGTNPGYSQGGSFSATWILQNHAQWIERAVAFMSLNEISGRMVPYYDIHQEINGLTTDTVAGSDPGAIYPRTLPEHYPCYVDVQPELAPRVPEWFPT